MTCTTCQSTHDVKRIQRKLAHAGSKTKDVWVRAENACRSCRKALKGRYRVVSREAV